MKRLSLPAAVLATLLLASPVVRANDDEKKKAASDQSASARFAEIQKERREAMNTFSVAYAKAKTAQEKNRVFTELYPKPEKFAKSYMDLAKEHPKDPAAVKALVEVVTLARNGELFAEALDVLKKQHVKAEEIGQVCQRLVYSPGDDTEKFLRQVLKENPHHNAQGLACYSLARYRKQLVAMARYVESQPQIAKSYEQAYGKEFMARLKTMEPEKLHQEVETLFERVAEEFADVKSFRGTLGESAKRELFEIRHLAIGREAPDIEGEDVDGVAFKLSDYRGKVVVIDFWGDW